MLTGDRMFAVTVEVELEQLVVHAVNGDGAASIIVGWMVWPLLTTVSVLGL